MIKLKNLLAENMRRFRTKNLSEASMNADSDQPTNSPIYRLYNSLVKDLGFKHESGTLSGDDYESKAIYVKYVPRPKKNPAGYSPLKLTVIATMPDYNSKRINNPSTRTEFDEIFFEIVASGEFDDEDGFGMSRKMPFEVRSMSRTYEGNGIHMTTQNLKDVIANFVKTKFGKKGFIYENMRRAGTKNLSEANLTDLENTLGFDSGANRDPKTGNLMSKKINWKSLEFEDIDPEQYPEFVDAYVSYAEYEDGSALTDDELEKLDIDYPKEVRNALEKYLH